MSTSLSLFGTLFLALGHPAKIPMPTQDLWISDPKILDAQILHRQALLRPRNLGNAYVVGIGDNNNPQRVQVLSYQNFQALKRCPQSKLQSGTISLQSKTLEPKDFGLLQNCGFTELEVPEAQRGLMQALFEEQEAHLLNRGIVFQKVSWQSNRRVLNVSTGTDLQRVRELLGPLQIFYQFEPSAGAKPGRTLIFEIVLFEFSTQRARAMGLKWPQSLQFLALDGELRVQQADGTRGLTIGADFGESEGVGRVLARPQIRSIPGEKALFQSGGELPIRSSNLVHSQTHWKSYGLLVELEASNAIQTGAKEVSLKFKVELSEPDGATAIDGVPGMLTRKLESRFDLRIGETTVLTTMIQSRSLENSSGFPGLRKVPVFGSVFGSQVRSAHDSELWFAIRPTWEGTLQ